MLARCYSRTHTQSHTTQKSSLCRLDAVYMHAASRSSCSYPYQNAVHAVAHRTLQITPPRGAARGGRARCRVGGLSLSGEDRGVRVHSIRGRFEAKQETRSSVYEQGTVHPCGSGSGLRGPLTGCLARTHRASAPKPTRMAVGLTRDCRETLRREVQGSSESSTRRSAYSKRHVGAPNRRTKFR